MNAFEEANFYKSLDTYVNNENIREDLISILYCLGTYTDTTYLLLASLTAF